MKLTWILFRRLPQSSQKCRGASEVLLVDALAPAVVWGRPVPLPVAST